MPPFISTFLQAWAERRRARRRRANLRAGARDGALTPGRPALTLIRSGADTAPVPPKGGSRRAVWIVAAAVCVAAGGGAVIAGHARHLAATTASTPEAANNVRAANAYQSVLPGIAFTVPSRPGIATSLHPGGALLVAAGMQASPAVRVDLCSQLRSPTGNDARLLPLRIGYRFDDVKRWVARNQEANVQIALRNVLLVSDSGAGANAMPEVQIEGTARADFSDPLGEPLRLKWSSRRADVRWLSDASLGQVEQGASGQVALRQQGWLLWGAASALRIERRANVLCPQAGELLVQMYRPAADAAATADTALVTAFPARGKAVGAYLAAGRYQVPAAAPGALEDQALFLALQEHGLVRLSAAGTIELAPRDLPQWLAADAPARAAELADWKQVKADATTTKLFKRLYHQADGAYVRQQIDIYNSERRLLAWRVKAPAGMVLDWNASVAGPSSAGGAPVMVSTTSQMPVAASRLFASLPQGWQPWTRVARWPQAGETPGGRPVLRLTLALPRPAAGGEVLRMMVAGRVDGGVSGASVQTTAACTGRACATKGDVQELTLALQAGVRSVSLDLRPLDFKAPEDQKYRHLRLAGGRVAWQALAATDGVANPSRVAAPAPVRLEDRNGTPLWNDGAPTQPAIDAGLAPLLGIGPEHANSVAGMLARLPSAGAQIDARLTLDLPLQALGQRILDCVGMRQGRWDGKACVGGQAAPEGRHAGLVILDTETGDVLAAAGAGAGELNSGNWAEVRDFDRTSPARSPLRLPALQHDGGAHQSPGSTFKVVSALGLEMAAKTDPQIDALLGGMPLPAINRLAMQRGFGFQTDAATYPLNPKLAHITNYREQSLDRRAQEGRLGLAQALTYSLNTWFAWSSELSDHSLFGRADGGAPDLQALDADALDGVRPIVAAAHRLGFEQAMRLDGGLLPADFNWRSWDALQATPAHIDTIHTRHELRQMAIGLRMQVTPLQMALASAAVGQGNVVAPRMLLSLDGADSAVPAMKPVGVRLDRIRAGMKGVVDVGTGAGAFGGAALASVRPGLYGKTGTAPTGDDTATVWFTGWLEPGSLPGQTHRLAMAAFVSHSDVTGGAHAAPVVAAVLATLAQQGDQKREQKREQKGK
ncbi:Penicillin binding protein transpeptidase domain-containing protein [Duganella sp. CF517]|uniref:penicillin-binding transpeptidase domain-containing protein n=1 Tax=Duganella sp. CF517 TaxID=1881038 RepID=UPI0008BB67C7|nr:penicillin-binding transpeptidase domain-containing protein [Duganella sp. CF517]SEO07634.1 Penicillin binding protein transpeptidase domain-containing protein [Duganella sp. CF517]